MFTLSTAPVNVTNTLVGIRMKQLPEGNTPSTHVSELLKEPEAAAVNV